MSELNYIAKMLEIKDENISIQAVEAKKYKNYYCHMVYSTLTYIPHACECCGHINKKQTIIKNGTKVCTILWGKMMEKPIYLKLRKQRFLCRHCHQTFIAKTTELSAYSNIANRVKQSVLMQSHINISEKNLGYLNFISHNTVHRLLNQHLQKHTVNFDKLPEHLCFDELKTTKDCPNKMSFVYCDAQTHLLLDILPFRRAYDLIMYFMKFSREARKNVKTITIDMNSPYMKVIHSIFPSAQIIIDRFHLVQLLTRTLNKLRVKCMNQVKNLKNDNGKLYRKLKKHWRLFLIPRERLDYVKFKKYVLFKYEETQGRVVDYMLSKHSELKTYYDIIQEMLVAYDKKDWQFFENLTIKNYKETHDYIKTTVKTLIKYKTYIKNSFIYTYSNGVIEGINNRLKSIIRTAYGYTKFYNFKRRALFQIHCTYYIDKNKSNKVA